MISRASAVAKHARPDLAGQSLDRVANASKERTEDNDRMAVNLNTNEGN